MFLTGVDKLNNINLNKANGNVPSEMLRLNLGIAPTAKPNNERRARRRQRRVPERPSPR